jgi:glycosyltransferase involved in cell wall biosynthesis
MSRISLIIPSKNRHSQIRYAVESGLSIHLISEVIIVDDCSSPELNMGLLSNLKINIDVRIVKTTCHGGAQGARVTGAQVAKNDILLFLDSDDSLIEL